MASNYVRIMLDEEVRGLARERASKTPVYRLSHRGPQANYIGHIGEIVIEQWLRSRGVTPEVVGCVDHDMALSYPGAPSLHFDVKTKDRRVQPLPEYEATIPAYAYDAQTPDYYAFVSLFRRKDDPDMNFTDAYIVGTITRSRFDQHKYFEPRGIKPNGANFFCDAWNVQIDTLDDPELFPPASWPQDALRNFREIEPLGKQ